MRHISIVAAAALIAACASRSTPANQPGGGAGGGEARAATEPPPATSGRTLDDQLGDWKKLALDAAQQMLGAPTCEARAAVMRDWLTQNRSALQVLNAEIQGHPPEEVMTKLEALMSDQATMEMNQRMEAAIDECGNDEAFVEAMLDVGIALGPLPIEEGGYAPPE